MIAKVEVRRQLALYEQKIKEEIKSIRKEIQTMQDSCTTNAMKNIWYDSVIYEKLNERLITLHRVLNDVIDFRCSEMLEDNVNS